MAIIQCIPDSKTLLKSSLHRGKKKKRMYLNLGTIISTFINVVLRQV